MVSWWVGNGLGGGKTTGWCTFTVVKNQDVYNLPTKEWGKTGSLFRCSLYKHVNVPQSGSAKHMRPVFRLYVCECVSVRASANDCVCQYCFICFFLAKVLLARSRAVKLSLLIVVCRKQGQTLSCCWSQTSFYHIRVQQQLKSFLEWRELRGFGTNTQIQSLKPAGRISAVWLRCGYNKHRAGSN